MKNPDLISLWSRSRETAPPMSEIQKKKISESFLDF